MTKPLSLLLIGLKWPPETFLDRLITGLTSRGVKVTICFANRPPKNWLEKSKCRWLWKPSWDTHPINRIMNLIRLAAASPFHKSFRTLIQLMRTTHNFKDRIRAFHQISPLLNADVDVVYFPWVLSVPTYIDWFNKIQIPSVTSLRGSMVNVYPLHPIDGERTRQKLRQALAEVNVIHSVSQHIFEEARQYGAAPSKVHVIRPAVDTTIFSPLATKAPNQRLTIITTGSIMWRKGLEYALLAMRQLADAGLNFDFQIIGDGPEKARILYTITDLGLEDHITMLGKLPPSSVRQHLQKADAFLLSSLSEGISNAVLEAMACGLPVVTTDCGGMREAVTDGVEGFVVPVRDPSTMAEKLSSLAQDPALRERMGKAARVRILKDFDQNNQVASFIELFTKVSDHE
jgi:colanic acid/amylovoran biosynthesis glycosyltransferase